MRWKKEDNFEALLEATRSFKIASTVFGPTSETNKIQITQPTGSNTVKSIRVRASDFENTDSEDFFQHYATFPRIFTNLKHFPSDPDRNKTFCEQIYRPYTFFRSFVNDREN